MDKRKLKQGFAYFLLLYFALAIGFYFIGGEQLQFSSSDAVSQSPEAVSSVGELTQGTAVTESFTLSSDTLDKISLLFGTYGRDNTGSLLVRILDSEENVLFRQSIDVSKLSDNGLFDIRPESPLTSEKGKRLALEITSADGASGNAVTVLTGVPSDLGDTVLTVNGQTQPLVLCLTVYGSSRLLIGRFYFVFAAAVGLLLLLLFADALKKQKSGKSSLILNAVSAVVRYRFLLSQLVIRDFKAKYKRSVLGVVWSLLNPLITMMVQYVIFSRLFRSDIDNFPVYLLTGIVFFNFFSEATTMSLVSITSNASLITKVYVPKYIFPVSRALSSSINLLISMIPLLLVSIIMRTPITPAILLLPFGILCMIAFCTGLALMLSAFMVFFRDTQFLWNIMIMLWMYATPIFYPVSIIPDRFMVFYKLNPLYHFIRFNRIVILQGVSPEPRAYLYCLVFALGSLTVGTLIFKKVQDWFVINL